MSGLCPSDEEDEYGNIIRRAPINYPSRLMNYSPEPEGPKFNDTLRALGDDEHMRKKSRNSSEKLERERLEAIEDTKRADKERAEENAAQRIKQAEINRQAAQKKAANKVLQAADGQKGAEKRVIKQLKKTTLTGAEDAAKTGDGKGGANDMK